MKAKNIVAFPIKTIIHLIKGSPTIGAKAFMRRQDICVACPSDQFDAENFCCSICECPIRDKSAFFNFIAWADVECPKGHWRKQTTSQWNPPGKHVPRKRCGQK